jgi:preprotein translocase subunit SecF
VLIFFFKNQIHEISFQCICVYFVFFLIIFLIESILILFFKQNKMRKSKYKIKCTSGLKVRSKKIRDKQLEGKKKINL